VTDDAEELDRRLVRLFKEGRRGKDPMDHPSPEKLSAYQANELPPKEADEVQEHLTGCSLCTELLLDLQRFLEPGEEDRSREGVADFGAEAGWRELREKISEKQGAMSSVLPRGTKNRSFTLSPLAASLILGLVLAPLLATAWWTTRLSGEVKELRQKVAEIRQPQVNVFTEDLRSTRSEVLKLPAGRPIQLNLTTSMPREYAEYPIEILNQEGRTIWAGVLKKNESGHLTLGIAPGVLEPGTYFIRLSGAWEGQEEDLEEYTVRLMPP
jgi:Putative zinc-finger